MADTLTTVEGCPERHIWEPKPHSVDLETEPRYDCSDLPNDAYYTSKG